MEYEDTVFVVAFLTIAVITVIGNILVILAVLSNRRLQNPANYLMMNLAVSDFFQGALSFPLRSAEALNNDEEKAIRCDVVIAITILFHSASNFNLALIALDRFIAVARPFAYATVVKTSVYKIVIALTWCGCLLLSGSIVVGWRNDENEESGKVCRFNTTLTMEYIIMYVFIVDLLPLVTMLVTYTYIFHATRRQISQIRAQEIAVRHANINQAFESRRPSQASWTQPATEDAGPGTSRNGIGHINPVQPEESSSGEISNNNNNNNVENNQSKATEGEKRPVTRRMSRQTSLSTQRTRKATRTVLVIIGFFLVLSMPISIIDTIELWCKTCGKIPKGVITAALCMAASNSCINVFVYGGYNTDYRKAYWNVWRRVKDFFLRIFTRTKTTVQSVQTSTT